MDHLFRLPKKIYFKSGSMNVALRELSEVYGCKRALLVTEHGLYASGAARPIHDWLRKQGIRTAEFFSIGEPPSVKELESALPKALEFQPDAIVGFGGLAAMSAAKALAALYTEPQLDLAEAASEPARIHTGSAVLALAAADYSGAQNSPFAVLRGDAGEELVIRSFEMLPELSVTDSHFVEGLSAEQVRSGARSILERSAQVYAAEGCTEYVQGRLLEAASAVLRHTKAAVEGCPNAREAIMNAASLLGMACGNVADTPSGGELPDPLAKALGYGSSAALLADCATL